MGHIVSRVTDPVIQIRTIAMDCIEYLIKILQIYSQTESSESEKQVEYLNAIKQKLVKTDSNVLLSAVSELAKVKKLKIIFEEKILIKLFLLIKVKISHFK